MKKQELDELMFCIGIYPKMNTVEKLSFLLDILSKRNENLEGFDNSLYTKRLRKLSSEKKASFTLFFKSLNIKEEMTRYKQMDIKWVHLFSTNYPKLLKEIYIPPIVLFYQGNIQLTEKYTWLGVVGSRDYTSYGKKVVKKVLPEIITSSKSTIGIVSGLAKGIDTEAHLTTIRECGQTIGVIGTGLDKYYPSKNRTLQQIVGKNYLLISEYPLGTKPLKHHFPERNRIIAGLSRGVLVVESKKSSGSLITAYNAIDEGRDVFAIPGSIFEENRSGNHRLIQLGAILTQSSEDVLNEWQYIIEETRSK